MTTNQTGYDTMEYESESETNVEPLFWDIETTGLNPTDDRIVCVGLGWFDDGKEVSVIAGKSEYHLVSGVREACRDFITDVESGRDEAGVETGDSAEVFVVSNYGRAFDHPFYTARCTGIYRQSPFPFGHKKKRLDISRVDGFTGSQDSMVDEREIDVGLNDTVGGKDVPRLYREDKIDVITNHCRSDVKELMALYEYEEDRMVEHLRDHYDME